MFSFTQVFGAAQHEKAPPSISQKKSVEERVVEDKPTAGYIANTPLRLLTGFQNSVPPLSLFYLDIEMMLMHPCVINSLRYFKSGISSAEFAVSGRHAAANKFVLSLYQRLWTRALNTLQQGYDYGWGGYEIVYRFHDGKLTFDTFKDFHPRDVRLLMKDRKYYGVRICLLYTSPSPRD